MLHLFQHRNGKFDIASVAKNGELLHSTNQGFETKQMVYKHLRSEGKDSWGIDKDFGKITFQDDTLESPCEFSLAMRGKPSFCGSAKHKKYIPSTRKKK